MYIHSVTLRNVRQFSAKTFEFRPGFNLLVGENGAGKTTILRSLHAVLAPPEKTRRKLPLGDDDISLRSNQLRVTVQLASPVDGGRQFATYTRSIGHRARRTRPHTSPLLLSYSSNEATCGSLVSRRIRQFSRQESGGDTRGGEEWLYQQERRPTVTRTTQPHFGRSDTIRNFVLQVLSTFSPRFRDFRWSFEPFDCAIIPNDRRKFAPGTDSQTAKTLEHLILRYFQETGNPLAEMDSPSVIVGSDGFIVDDKKNIRTQVTPPFGELASRLEFKDDVAREFSDCTVKVRLTPRIRVLDESGDSFLISQLSDGEQRLFSLFVDIARQLSLDAGDDRPLASKPAVALIDEIDVHLHPKWQRLIVPSLEDLFPACQFIATTHSPFVIQAVSEAKLTHLNGTVAGDFQNRGIEEIAVKVMGIENHEVSHRYLEMLDTAREYFRLLEKASAGPASDKARLADLKRQLDTLSHRYAHNPAYQAYLELHGELALAPEKPQ